MLKVDLKGNKWTYGAEHELADWDTSIALLEGYTRADDWSLVNSNGVAVQPSPKQYRYGGEINTPPTNTPAGQCRCLEQIMDRYSCAVNYRSNLHIHIRVPGLVDSLKYLKQVQKYVHDNLPQLINLIEPIPAGKSLGEKKRAKRRKVSHHTFLTHNRIAHQLAADNIKDFFEREVPRGKAGQVMWHAQPRLAVNLRQLLQTETIEFRHFPGTLDQEELLACIEWCRDFLIAALADSPIDVLWKRYTGKLFPKFPDFDMEMEVKYQATAAHNGLSREEIQNNIRLILEGGFYGTEAENKARQRACGLLR